MPAYEAMWQFLIGDIAGNLADFVEHLIAEARNSGINSNRQLASLCHGLASLGRVDYPWNFVRN